MMARLTIREHGPEALRLEKPHECRSAGQVLGCSGLIFVALFVVNTPVIATAMRGQALDLRQWAWLGMTLLLALMILAGVFDGGRRAWLLDARRETGRFVLGDRDGSYPPSEPTSTPFSEIHAIALEIPHGFSTESDARPGQGHAPIDIEILGSGDAPLHPRTTLHIDGVATRSAALDLLRTLGDLVGLRHFRVLRNDPRDFRIRADRAADRGLPGVEIDADAPALAEARTPFDPAVRLPRPYRLREWAPGSQVRIDKGWSVGPLLPALAGFLLAGLLLWLQRWPGTPDFLFGGVNASLIPVSAIALVVAAVGLHRARPGHALFDWTSGELVVRVRGRTRRASLGEVEGLELTEEIHVERPTGHSFGGAYGHHYTVTARLAGGNELALLRAGNVITRVHGDGRIRDYRALYPLVSHLAGALRVPLRFE